MNILFTKKQVELFENLKSECSEEIIVWRILNVLIPVIIILIPLFLYSFLPDASTNVQNLILNGSFSLLGINILFSMSTFLINSVRLKDEKFEAQIINLRKRLILYLIILLILSTLIYVLQIAFIIDTSGKYITVGISCPIFLLLSVLIGEKIFLVKDELVGLSYKDDININLKNLKSATDDLE